MANNEAPEYEQNPHFEDHMRKERAYVGGEYKASRAAFLVRLEFEGMGHRNAACRKCSATTWYRPMICGFKCPSCGDVETTKHLNERVYG